VLRATRAITEPQSKNDVTSWVGKFFNLDEKVSDEFYRRVVPWLNPSGIVERANSCSCDGLLPYSIMFPWFDEAKPGCGKDTEVFWFSRNH
jgi:hypothetical protein